MRGCVILFWAWALSQSRLFVCFWSGTRLTNEHVLFYIDFILSVRAFKNGTWNTRSGCYSSLPPTLLLPFPSTYFLLLSICVVLGCHTLEIEGASQPAENEALQDMQERILDYWVHFRISSSPFSLLVWLHNMVPTTLLPAKKNCA